MRVNIYAEEMTDRVEIISKEINGQTFTGLRLYLYLPVTKPATTQHVSETVEHRVQQLQGPFIHGDGDDDSSAVTFWGKRDLRETLKLMQSKLDEHYKARGR